MLLIVRLKLCFKQILCSHCGHLSLLTPCSAKQHQNGQKCLWAQDGSLGRKNPAIVVRVLMCPLLIIKCLCVKVKAYLEDDTPLGLALDVLTGLEQAQGHTVQQDDQHAYMLEPGEQESRKTLIQSYKTHRKQV